MIFPQKSGRGLRGPTLGLGWAIATIGALTFVSGVVVAIAMKETASPVGNDQIDRPQSAFAEAGPN